MVRTLAPQRLARLTPRLERREHEIKMADPVKPPTWCSGHNPRVYHRPGDCDCRQPTDPEQPRCAYCGIELPEGSDMVRAQLDVCRSCFNRFTFLHAR